MKLSLPHEAVVNISVALIAALVGLGFVGHAIAGSLATGLALLIPLGLQVLYVLGSALRELLPARWRGGFIETVYRDLGYGPGIDDPRDALELDQRMTVHQDLVIADRADCGHQSPEPPCHLLGVFRVEEDPEDQDREKAGERERPKDGERVTPRLFSLRTQSSRVQETSTDSPRFGEMPRVPARVAPGHRRHK